MESNLVGGFGEDHVLKFKKVINTILNNKPLELNEEIEVKWPDGTTTQHAIESINSKAWIAVNHREHSVSVSLDGLLARRC